MNDLDRETVRERLLSALDGEVLRFTVTAKRGQTVYALVSRLVEQNGRETLDLRTVVVDLGADSVRVTGNGLWVPADVEVAGQLLETVANAKGHLKNGTGGCGLTAGSAVDTVDAGLLLDRTMAVEQDPRQVHGWGVEWGNGQGPPPEVFDLVERLAAAGVETDRFSRLEFGGKAPFERYANRSTDSLLGNYGVETLEGDALIIIDVDDPAAAPVDDLPPTYRVSSPHGDDDRAHHYLVVDDADAVREHFGTGAVKPGWGDVWLSGEYVVGPGCVLTDCSKAGCDVCSGPGGRYRVLDDRPITEVSADWLIDLLDVDDDQGDDVDDDVVDLDPADLAARDDVDDDQGADSVECHDCSADVDADAARLVDRDGTPVYVCEGCA